MNEQERFSQSKARLEYGKPNTDEISQFIDRYLPEQRRVELGMLRDEEWVLDRLQFKKTAFGDIGVNPSRLTLSTEVVLNIKTFFTRRWEEALGKHDIPLYRFFYDLSYGVERVVSRLRLAELVVSGNTETQAAASEEAISIAGEAANIPISEQTEGRLNQVKKEQRSARLLIDDPSGFKLIDDLIEGMRGTKFVISAEEYAIAGAKLASDADKLVYDFSSKLQ